MHYEHGNDKYKFLGKIEIDFSSNVWCNSLSDWFYQKLNSALKNTIDYPHPSALDLVQELSLFHNLPIENIWATNGSIEGIYLVAQAFAGEKSAIIWPSFSEYENACKRYNHSVTLYSNKNNWYKQNFKEGLVWFGNPNNPDGTKISKEVIEYLLSSNTNSIFVIDEAFADLCIDFESALSLFEKYKNFILFRSFTKAFSIPGIRLGYVIAPNWIIEKLNKLSIPWSVNSLAIDAGKIILQNYSKLLPKENELKELNNFLYEKLNEIPELYVFPSNCNFFLIRLKKGEARELKNYLATKKEILIRDASNFQGLDNSFIRLSVQSKVNTEKIVSAIKSYYYELS